VTRQNLLSDPSVNSKKKQPGYYLDGHGLYLQVAPGGSRSWIYRYTRHGKSREMGLGSISVFSLAQARERAKACRQLLADDIDPIVHRDAARAARIASEAEAVAHSKTFGDCADEYHRVNADKWKNAKHAAQWINTLRTYAVTHFGEVPIKALTKQHVVDALAPIWTDKAETASRTLQRIRMVFNFAAAKDYCEGRDAEFWAQVKLALGANDRARKVAHHSACPHKDVGALLERIDDGPSGEVVKLALRFIVLTAARSGEVRGARWSEVNEQAHSWIVPAERMKAGRKHHVPLCQDANDVLARVKSIAPPTSGESLIFPSPRGKILSDMVFTQILRRLNDPKVPYTVHGFRASFRTWGSEHTEYSHEMLEFALAHIVGDQTVQAYARGSMVEKRRQLMQDWANYLREAVDSRQVRRSVSFPTLPDSSPSA
jgi:integrase